MPKDFNFNTMELVELVTELKQYSVLVIDDEEVVLMLFADILKHFFKHVGFAQRISIAAEKINKYQYDAIITDNVMPDVFGSEFIKKIRNGEVVTKEQLRNKIEHMPIYIITRSEKSHIADILALPNVYYIEKPLDTKKILELLYGLLKSLSLITTQSVEIQNDIMDPTK